MKGTTVQVRNPGGLVEQLPQPPEGASEATNLTVDKATLCWSTRIGYEKFRPNGGDLFNPFGSTGRIDSLFVYNQLANGARYHILFESNGELYLYYESYGSAPVLRTLSSGRSVPTPTQPCSQYTVVGDAVLVTNGVDHPILVRPWPLGGSVDSGVAIGRCVRNLGFAVPSAPDALQIIATTGVTTTARRNGGDAIALWWPANPISMASGFGGIGGIGFSEPDSDGNKTSVFSWRMSFISDTGSESPMSSPVEVTWDNEGTVGYRYAAALRPPLGPRGTVARRFYRTNNYGKGLPTQGDTTFYFNFDLRNNVDELVYDAYRPASLGATAPSASDSVAFPAPTARFSAVYADCLFLDGGLNDPLTLFYSSSGRPDQFAAASFITLSGANGGITGLFAYYNVLVVFRENGVDVVKGSFNSGFSVTTVTSQVSCKSPNTVDTVPDVGIVFLAADGIYAINGGFEGGSVFRVVKLSDSIDATISRATQDCLARAVGRYSPYWSEYHCYFPADGQDRPSLGLVYHVDKKGWSLREDFPVGALDRMPTEELVFGHNTGAETTSGLPCGLFIISGRRNMGGTVIASEYVLSAAPTSRWRSPWLDLGDPQAKKKCQYVTLWMLTTGNVSITLTHYKDFERTGITETSYYAQPPDQDALPVYDSAILDSTVWEKERLVPIRISVANQSCSWFSFAFETSDDLVFAGWEVEYAANGTRVVAGQRVS